MKARFLALAVLCLLLTAGQASANIITVTWSAKAATVAQKPFGLTIPLNTVITGYFTFDTDTTDENPSPFDGEYQHDGNSGFLAEILGSEVSGSGTAFYWVDLLDQNPENDTFRIYDGPRNVGFEGGVMSFDGIENEEIELFVAITADVFDDDDLINPFPFYMFGFLGTTHTFSLKDEQGTVLLQFVSVAEAVCGDPTGNGVTAGDALQVLRTSVGSRTCYACICDADGNGNTNATDALKVLRFAVSGSPTLDCAVCA